MKTRLLILLLSIVFLLACEMPTSIPSCLNSTQNSDREFFVFSKTADSQQWCRISTNRVFTTSHSLIYQELGETLPAGADINSIANEFENRIYPQLVEFYGEPSDLDNNNRVIIVLLDIKDGATVNSDYVAGYFTSADLYRGSNSNGGEIIYIDINNPRYNAGNAPENTQERIYNTLAHEFQHLIYFSRGGNSSLETWLVEGNAMSAEEMYNEAPLISRIQQYFHDRDGDIARGNNFLKWDGKSFDYASSYLLFHYLRSHAGTNEIYRGIYNSDQLGYKAITTTLAAQNYPSFASLLPAEDDSEFHVKLWENLLGHFFAATVLQTQQVPIDYKPNSDSSGESQTVVPGPPLLGFKSFNGLNANEGRLLFAPRERIIAYNNPIPGDATDATNYWSPAVSWTSAQTRLANSFLVPGDRIIIANNQFLRERITPSDYFSSTSELSIWGITYSTVVLASLNNSYAAFYGLSAAVSVFDEPQLIQNPDSEVNVLIAFNPNPAQGSIIQLNGNTLTPVSAQLPLQIETHSIDPSRTSRVGSVQADLSVGVGNEIYNLPSNEQVILDGFELGSPIDFHGVD